MRSAVLGSRESRLGNLILGYLFSVALSSTKAEFIRTPRSRVYTASNELYNSTILANSIKTTINPEQMEIVATHKYIKIVGIYT